MMRVKHIGLARGPALAACLSVMAGLLGAAAGAHAQCQLVHIVRPSETLASIADAYYGDARREGVLVAENGLTSEGGSQIVVGLRLTVPSVAYHKVGEGETWTAIANAYYGEPTRAFEIIEANNASSGAQPDVGAELVIPYPLRHVVGQHDTLRTLTKLYYSKSKYLNTIKRFNEVRSVRVERGDILLVPLDDLRLSKLGQDEVATQCGHVSQGELRDKQTDIANELTRLHNDVTHGRYLDAVGLANRLIGVGDLTGNQEVTLRRELATAFAALGQDNQAIEAYKQLLARQPDMELDTVRTSPKVLRLFERAKQDVAKQDVSKRATPSASSARPAK